MLTLLRATFVLFLIFFMSSCEEKSSKRLLKIGISPWPGYEPLVLASQQGFFKNSRIRIIRFGTPTESYRALRDGLIDVAAFTADEVFHYAEVRDKPRIFLIMDVSNGADAIVARKDIKSLDDLKGKKVGVEASALGDYVIHRALDFTKSLKLTDIELKIVEINEQVQAFKEHKIDAAVTYEPSKSLLLNAGAHVLFDSSQISQEIVDVLVTNEEMIKKHPEMLADLAKGWFEALDYIDHNYHEAMHVMSEYETTTIAEFQKGYEDLVIPSLQENLEMLGVKGSLISPMKRLSELMLEKGSLQKHIDVTPLLDDTIIKLLQR